MYNVNDYEQLYLIGENDDNAKELVFEKYKPIIISLAKKYHSYMGERYDIEDFVQEGFVGLNKAINLFDDSKDILFYTFSCVCIERQIQSYYRKLTTQKNYHFNNSYSLDAEIENSSYINVIEDNDDNRNPIKYNELNTIYKDIIHFKNNLTTKQSLVFELRCNGFKYKEIATLLDMPVSLIDNIIHIYKEKLKNSCLNSFK